MDKLKAFLNRYAVLVSVIWLALLGIFEVLKGAGFEWAGWAVTALGTIGGLFGVSPSPEVAAAVPLAVASGVALYGAILKITKLVKTSLAK